MKCRVSTKDSDSARVAADASRPAGLSDAEWESLALVRRLEEPFDALAVWFRFGEFVDGDAAARKPGGGG